MSGFLRVALLLLVALPAAGAGQGGFRSRCGAEPHVDDRGGFTPLPQGSLFCPFVADPKS